MKEMINRARMHDDDVPIDVVLRPIVIDPSGILPGRAPFFRARLARLDEERFQASKLGLLSDRAYADDLRTDIAETRRALGAAELLRLAILRGEISGRHHG